MTRGKETRERERESYLCHVTRVHGVNRRIRVRSRKCLVIKERLPSVKQYRAAGLPSPRLASISSASLPYPAAVNLRRK